MLIGVEPEDNYLDAMMTWREYPYKEQLLCDGILLLNGDRVGGIEFQERDEDGVLVDVYFDSPEEYQDELKDARVKFWPFVNSHIQYLRYWNSGNHPDVAPLNYYIEWALSKNFRPSWLDRAIEFGLYTPKQEAAQPALIVAAPGYSTSWLTIQQAAINQFYNPRRDTDAKRHEVVEWIKTEAGKAGLLNSNNIATAIFTIIKRENHDPRKK